jgi:hypothetical protein
MYEQGLAGHCEELASYDPHDPGSCEAGVKFMDDVTMENVMLGYGAGGLGLTHQELAGAGPVLPFLTWQKSMKDLFDPNEVTDTVTYFTAEKQLSGQEDKL